LALQPRGWLTRGGSFGAPTAGLAKPLRKDKSKVANKKGFSMEGGGKTPAAYLYAKPNRAEPGKGKPDRLGPVFYIKKRSLSSTV
jgi:hypothetical protein